MEMTLELTQPPYSAKVSKEDIDDGYCTVELQETRRFILEILKQQKECTVEAIVQYLAEKLQRPITTVTVRHHLDRLRAEDLVNAPEIRRRNSPGRPQYIYTLTAKAEDYFPNNYANFTDHLLLQLKQHLPPENVNVILQDMAHSMASEADLIPQAPLVKRVEQVVAHLNAQGYCAFWDHTEGGYLVATTNCPYERVANHHEELCQFDIHLMTALLGGIVPRFMGRLREGDPACQYFIPATAPEPA